MKKTLLNEIKAMNKIAGTKINKEQEISFIKNRLNELSSKPKMISKSVVKESIDTNYWIKYNKNPNGESSQSKKSNNFEYTFKDALNDWNSEGEDAVSGSDAQKIKKLAKEFFDKEGYITYNIVYAMIMQS